MRFLDKIFNNINRIKISNLRKKLIASTSFLVLLLIMISFVLFYISSKNSYIQQLESSNENLIKQIGFSYEMVLSNVKNCIYKTALTDVNLLELVQKYDNSVDCKNTMFKNLYSIILSNEYIQSAYLYILDYDLVLSTSNNTEKISSFENFSDKDAFCMIDDKAYYSLEPRIIEYNGTKKQILSIVSSVPLYDQHHIAFLVVNVDLDKLRYNMIVKFTKDQNMRFYIVNNQNSIIIAENINISPDRVLGVSPVSKNSQKSLWDNIFHSNVDITSVYYSKPLKWKFVLENSIDTSAYVSTNFAERLTWFISASICLSIVSLFVLILVITAFTKPVNKMAVKYNENLWRDFITDNLYLNDEMKEQLIDGWFKTSNAKFGTIVLHFEDKTLQYTSLDYYRSALTGIVGMFNEKDGLKIKLITTAKNSIAIIVCYLNFYSLKSCEEQHMKIAETIYTGIDSTHRHMIYLGISTIKDHINLIPASYRECIEMFKYKLTCGSHLLPFSIVRDRKESYKYPLHLEKQLLNNLSAGNLEACKLISEEFFRMFTNPNLKVEDNEIISSAFYLENSILKNTRNLPISLEDTAGANISNAQTIDEIKVLIDNIIEEVCLYIAKRDSDEKKKLYDMVLDYIDKNYTQPDISLNKIADALKISRNFVSKIISETAGISFTDYINGKRITHAKEMLQDKAKTIKDIAEEVGFNYSYYFIKIFKSIEGITPGEYRNSISNY